MAKEKRPVLQWYRHPRVWGIPVGANFFPLVSLSNSYLLWCILFLFALLYFVNYAPLLRAVCKFGYSLLSAPLFLPEFYVFISVTVFVAVAFFSVSLTTNPCYPQYLVSGFVFIVFFNFVLQCPLGSFFCIVTIIFSLFEGIYFFLVR